MARDIVKHIFGGMKRLQRGAIGTVSSPKDRQIEDAPYHTIENGVMRPMTTEDFVRIGKRNRSRG